MTVTSITATREEIRFSLDTPCLDARIRVSAFSAALGEEGELCSFAATVTGDSFTMPRRLAGRDGLSLCYTVNDTTGEVPGVRYVTTVAHSLHAGDMPTPKTKKGLHVGDGEAADALALGIRHAALSVSLGDVLMPFPEGDNTLYYRFEGRDVYIRRSVAESLDSRIRTLTDGGASVYLILLNAPVWETEVSARFWEAIRHPGCAADAISLPDVVRERGCFYYRAFVSFLAERYTREDGKYGRMHALTVGNEVNTPQLWASAGEMTLPEYAEQYASALRIAWQCATAVHSGIRVFASIDASFTAPRDENSYAGRDFLVSLMGICRREGDFPWHLACRIETEADSDAPCLTAENLGAVQDVLADSAHRLIVSEFACLTDGTPTGDTAQADAFRRTWETLTALENLDAAFYATYTDPEDTLCGLSRRDGSARQIRDAFREAR